MVLLPSTGVDAILLFAVLDPFGSEVVKAVVKKKVVYNTNVSLN